MKLHNSRKAFGSNLVQVFEPTPTKEAGENTFYSARRFRRAGKGKKRPVWAGRACLGPPICFRETYDGTALIAGALGKTAIGPHHVRNAIRRVRQARAT